MSENYLYEIVLEKDDVIIELCRLIYSANSLIRMMCELDFVDDKEDKQDEEKNKLDEIIKEWASNIGIRVFNIICDECKDDPKLNKTK